MVLDLVIKKSDDGYTAEVPSISGCECWAHEEEEVISKSLELVSFYLNLPGETDIIVDKARKVSQTTVYKLVFDK